MKAKEFIIEGKKGRRDIKRTIKPRNPVAHAAQSVVSGSGTHKDKKKAQKQGDLKHKGKMFSESNLINVLSWPEVVNKVNSAMKAMGWEGQRKGDGAFMFNTKGQETDDQEYFVIIDNEGNGMFTYALGTVEEGDPNIGEQDTLPTTEASVSELMDAIRDGFGLGESAEKSAGDEKFDNMMKTITNKRSVNKQRKADNQQRAQDAFNNMFGGDADFLTRGLNIKKKNVEERKVSEISKPTLARYVKAAGKDVEQRASSQSFKSGQAGDKYNKADVTHKDTRREKGIDRALSRLSK